MPSVLGKVCASSSTVHRSAPGFVMTRPGDGCDISPTEPAAHVEHLAVHVRRFVGA